jgi:hypothetical protein
MNRSMPPPSGSGGSTRWSTVQELAAAIVFLGSDDTRYNKTFGVFHA